MRAHWVAMEMEHGCASGGPPPLPRPQVTTTPGWKTGLFAFGAISLLFVGAVIAIAAFYFLTRREFEPTTEHKAALHTAADLKQWFDFDVDEACEHWSGERMFDGAIEIEYEYDDPRDEAPYVNTSLHYEPKASDAVANFTLLWQGARAGVGLTGGDGMGVEESNDLFRWGDVSRFAFLTRDGSRHGMVFCGRKGKCVYLLLTGGACLEEAAELEEFLRPKLEAIERLEFRKR